MIYQRPTRVISTVRDGVQDWDFHWATKPCIIQPQRLFSFPFFHSSFVVLFNLFLCFVKLLLLLYSNMIDFRILVVFSTGVSVTVVTKLKSQHEMHHDIFEL
jgi:hypothetical protein